MPKIEAYHGTTDLLSEQILSEGKFNESTKPTEWLGTGIYFFAYKYDAKAWAKQQCEKHENAGQNMAILVADIVYDDIEHCLLDLDDTEQLEEVNDFMRALLKRASPSVMCTFNGNDKLKKWAAVCNLFRQYHENVALTSYTFRFTNRSASKYYPENQKQLCVSHPQIIGNIRQEVYEP